MENTLCLSIAITEFIASNAPEEDLPCLAALFTAIGDQLALLVVCKNNGNA